MQNNASPAGEKRVQEERMIRKFMGFLDFEIGPSYDSWNDLMDVVEKIEDMGYYIGIDRNFCMVGTVDTYGMGIPFLPTRRGENKFTAVYLQCINFITWYNQQTPSNDKEATGI